MEELTNYSLFRNSNEIVRLNAYGVVSAVAHLLMQFNKTKPKTKETETEVIFKDLETEIRVNEGLSVAKFSKYAIGIYRQKDDARRAFYKAITERFCNNPAFYKKVFECFSAWCTDNDTTNIVCDIEDIMKYGYEKTEGGRRYHYKSKIEFCQVVYDLLDLEFYTIKDKASTGETFRLLMEAGQKTFEVKTLRERAPILKKINFKYCAGLPKNLFYHRAMVFPKKSLKMIINNPDTYELARFVHSVLYFEAEKGHKGKMLSLIHISEPTRPY